MYTIDSSYVPFVSEFFSLVPGRRAVGVESMMIISLINYAQAQESQIDNQGVKLLKPRHHIRFLSPQNKNETMQNIYFLKREK